MTLRSSGPYGVLYTFSSRHSKGLERGTQAVRLVQQENFRRKPLITAVASMAANEPFDGKPPKREHLEVNGTGCVALQYEYDRYHGRRRRYYVRVCRELRLTSFKADWPSCSSFWSRKGAICVV